MRRSRQDPRHRLRLPNGVPGVMALVGVILGLGLEAEASVPGMAEGVSMSRLALADSNQTSLENRPGSESAKLVAEDQTRSRLVAWWRFDESDGRRWPLALLLVAAVALTAGVYGVRRGRNSL